MKSPLVSKATAIMNRNAYWEGNPKIPSWVDVEGVDLDQFFTKADIAKRCHDHFMKTISADGARPSDYKFIEPSAGNGAFLDLLPAERRIGIDIMPQMPEVLLKFLVIN